MWAAGQGPWREVGRGHNVGRDEGRSYWSMAPLHSVDRMQGGRSHGNGSDERLGEAEGAGTLREKRKEAREA